MDFTLYKIKLLLLLLLYRVTRCRHAKCVRQTCQLSRVTRESHGFLHFLQSHGRGNSCSRVYSCPTVLFSTEASWCHFVVFSFRFANFTVGKINFKVGKINFNVDKINFKVGNINFKVGLINFLMSVISTF